MCMHAEGEVSFRHERASSPSPFFTHTTHLLPTAILFFLSNMAKVPAATKRKGKAAPASGVHAKASRLESKLKKLAARGEESGASEAEGEDVQQQEDFVALSSTLRAKITKTAKSKTKKAGAETAKAKDGSSGTEKRVVYLGHVPHGFFEEQMKGFFSQFGEVLRVRLSRSKKTGMSVSLPRRLCFFLPGFPKCHSHSHGIFVLWMIQTTANSRGYAFIEFEAPEVAEVVAETMNGYYLSGRKLVCHLVEPNNVHPRYVSVAS